MSESRSGARDVSCQLLSEYPMSEVRQYGSVKAERGTYPVYALFNFLEETSDAYGGQVRHRIPPIFSLELGRSFPFKQSACIIKNRSKLLQSIDFFHAIATKSHLPKHLPVPPPAKFPSTIPTPNLPRHT